MLSKWLRFWFEPSAPFNLGLSRALFFGGLLLFYSREDFSAWGSVSPSFWMPLPLFSALHLSPMSTAGLDVAQTLWRCALVLSAVGFCTRTSMAIAAVLGTYLMGLPHNFGHTFHFDAVLVITGAVLAFSRAGDAWSLDAAMGRVRSDEPGGEYTWPVRLVWLATTLVFFAAGIAKLRHGGIAWITSDNMRILLLRAAYHVSDADPITGAGLWIASHTWLARVLAAASLFIEVGFAASLFSRRARAFFVPAAFFMLLGIRTLMGPTFGAFLIVNVFWVPWDGIAARLAVWRTRYAPSVVADQPDASADNSDHGAGAGPKDVAVEQL